MPTTWLALARLGAVMVPINIAYTPREMSYVVGDAEGGFLVIDEDRLDTLAALPERPSALTDDRVFVVGTPRDGAAALGRAARRRGATRFARDRGRLRRPDEHPVHVRHDRAFRRAACCRIATGSRSAR